MADNKKRRMMWIPEVHPTSFVFFFEKGDSGNSWSIRDYSAPSRVSTYGPDQFPYTANEIRQKARCSENAPTVPTKDLDFWHKYTLECNRRNGLPQQTTGDAEPAPPHLPARTAATPEPKYPILNLPALLQSSKAQKPQDMERILTSPQSEDWVTWNFFQLLNRRYPQTWWSHFLEVARRRNSSLTLYADARFGPPALNLWTRVPAPTLYEVQSRIRMSASGKPQWIQRAAHPAPVEGISEIDISLESGQVMIFIEAKLGSDISMSTSYDPGRNQIIRNIDCVLERAGSRQPAFWMLVRDLQPTRSYVQLMQAYQADPGILARDLPHRDLRQIREIAQNLTILLWSDFAGLVCSSQPVSDPEAAAVIAELSRRIL